MDGGWQFLHEQIASDRVLKWLGLFLYLGFCFGSGLGILCNHVKTESKPWVPSCEACLRDPDGHGVGQSYQALAQRARPEPQAGGLV